ncbi:prepilin peptidase [Gordonia soli]|uniref:Prepilin type IV endopeptidase peptidase domain-containing protein n=1 Tax=Gordonia soli NBRC 108243 TaxID=1223545 RepID=M0QJS7_9ACTN|nr:prepilin peptidase [Gordonia soli]GAC68808.1 hypothetical protein GS4_18_00960 [Gordonia soli NBRC 108243]
MSVLVSPIVVAWLVLVAVRDARTGRIPNAVLWPGVCGVVAMGSDRPIVIGAAVAAAAPYLAAWWVGHCGGGDPKLAFAVGGLTADVGIAAVTVMTAAAITVVVHLLSDDSARRGRSTGQGDEAPESAAGARPHGPALVTAALAWMVGW